MHRPAAAPFSPAAARAEGLAAVLLATPADVSMELAPALLDSGVKVIDLSGAFRLGTTANYERWYKEPHTQPDLLAEAAYGLPEFCRTRIPGARLIANPGCYPTAANLAIRPLLQAGVVVREAGIVCDAKSGVSGAGRKPSLKTSFCEVTENFSAYSILDHRHVPEILRTSGLEEGELSFTAQLLPIGRGILETICSAPFRRWFDRRAHGRLPGNVTARNLSCVCMRQVGRFPTSMRWRERISAISACGTTPPTRRAVVVAAIDDTGKGAAGQAVQNMNLMLGYPETAGLL